VLGNGFVNPSFNNSFSGSPFQNNLGSISQFGGFSPNVFGNSGIFDNQANDTSLFFQSNSGISPFLVNNSLNPNFGFNTANTTPGGFTSLNGVTSFNNGFNGTGVPVSANALTTQALINARATNTTMPHVFRARPAFNPTLPNPPGSAYPQVATAQSLAAAATNSGVLPPLQSGSQVHWTGPSSMGAYNVLPPLKTGSQIHWTGPNSMGTYNVLPPLQTGSQLHWTGPNSTGTYNVLPPLQTGSQLHWTSGMPLMSRMGPAVVGGSTMSAGVRGGGVMVFGGRAR